MKLFRTTGGPLGPAAICLALVGCIEIVEPSPPDIDLPDAGGACAGTCSCSPADIINRAYRFTTLTVEEPAVLSGTLDYQWEGELSNYLLNVIFVVNSAEQAAGSASAFSNINLTAGPGWRQPGYPYQVDDTFEVSSFCLIDQSMNLTVDVAPEAGAQCTFASQTTSNLYYHLGPGTDPLMCAPLLQPQNATPIMDLSFSFGFNSDCSAITSGYLSGCIPEASAEKICVCLTAGTCPTTNANPATEFPEDWATNEKPTIPLVDYCTSTCGHDEISTLQWGSFRATMYSLSVESGGCTVNGEPGFPLSARFTAEVIPLEKFNPTISPDCSLK